MFFQRYRIFFFPAKFVFAHFLGKIKSVSKKAVFFFSRAGKKKQLLRLSESVRFNLYQGKKRTKIKKTHFGKKNHFFMVGKISKTGI